MNNNELYYYKLSSQNRAFSCEKKEYIKMIIKYLFFKLNLNFELIN